MSRYQLDGAVEDLDKAMTALREAMKGIQIRTAGFKGDHDELARAVGAFTVDLLDAQPLMKK